MHIYLTATNARHKASDAQALEKWHDMSRYRSSHNRASVSRNTPPEKRKLSPSNCLETRLHAFTAIEGGCIRRKSA